MRSLALLLAFPGLLFAQVASAAATPEQLINARRFEEARTTIDAMLARDRHDANALYYMGRLAYAQGNSGHAVGWFEKAVERSERSAVYQNWLGNALGDEAQKANKLRQPML